MQCVKHVVFQLVRPIAAYPEGRRLVVPLLMSLLPAIDLNDYDKILLSFEIYDIILSQIVIVDCSSAVKTRNGMTTVRYEYVNTDLLLIC